MNENNDIDNIIQNLKDAGCAEADIDSFLLYWKSGHTRQALLVLEKHRKLLLEALHKSKARIDCLDYLVYRMEHEAAQKNIQEVAQ